MLKGPSVLSPKPFADQIRSQANDTAFTPGVWPNGWMTPREPEEGAVIVQEDGICLKSSPAPLYSVDSRNLLLHRQESFRFDAELTLELPKLEDGQEAGLVCYYDENTWVSFMVQCGDTGYACTLTERIGTESFVRAVHPLEHPEAAYSFAVKTDGLKRTFILRSADGEEFFTAALDNVYYLCDEGIRMGKRFTGATFGAAAYGPHPFTYKLRSVTIENMDRPE